MIRPFKTTRFFNRKNILATVGDAALANGGTGVIWYSSETIASSTASTAIANAVLQLTDTADFAANFATGEGGLLLMQDGTHAFLFEYKADGTPGTTAAADLTLLAVLTGAAGTASAIHTDNFG